jgi:hypothetical protein
VPKVTVAIPVMVFAVSVVNLLYEVVSFGATPNLVKYDPFVLKTLGFVEEYKIIQLSKYPRSVWFFPI